jgi:hypothetical protein
MDLLAYCVDRDKAGSVDGGLADFMVLRFRSLASQYHLLIPNLAELCGQDLRFLANLTCPKLPFLASSDG